LGITVKDFAKTLKISDKALIERMQKAGLSSFKSSDEITPSDKQALLKFLKGAKSPIKICYF
jgi:translation initiation factor IF-2